MRFAIFADPHLSDIPNTVQEAALDWALRKAEEIGADALLCAGDVTACGSADAAMRYTEKLRSLPFPTVTVPGNSDLRNTNTAPLLERLFSVYPGGLKLGELRVVGMDFSNDTIPEEERTRLSGFGGEEPLLLMSHQGHGYLDEDSRAFLSSWLGARRERILLWATGHSHIMQEQTFAGVREISLRALDPDKCIGGLPHLVQIDTDGETVTLSEHLFTEGLLPEWSEEEKREFVDCMGVTCYHPEREMEEVIRLGIRHMEWRDATDETLPLLRLWRQNGGGTFSLHLPSLDYDGGVKGGEAFTLSAMKAVRAEADMITVHPPYLPIRLMTLPGAFETLADSMARALLPVREAGIPIMVENNHTYFGTPHEIDQRPFGCAPIEVVTWRDAMNERLGKDACAIRLDIGHARNNVPVSLEYPLGKWYALIGSHARTYHLHQTTMEPSGKMHNHFPITGLTDGVVSFCGFLHQWHTGVLTHGPVILEIREGEGAIETYKRMKRLIMEV